MFSVWVANTCGVKGGFNTPKSICLGVNQKQIESLKIASCFWGLRYPVMSFKGSDLSLALFPSLGGRVYNEFRKGHIHILSLLPMSHLLSRKKGGENKFQTPFPPFPPPVLFRVNQKWQFLVYILGQIIFSAPSLKMPVRDLPAGFGEEEQFGGFLPVPVVGRWEHLCP